MGGPCGFRIPMTRPVCARGAPKRRPSMHGANSTLSSGRALGWVLFTTPPGRGCRFVPVCVDSVPFDYCEGPGGAAHAAFRRDERARAGGRRTRPSYLRQKKRKTRLAAKNKRTVTVHDSHDIATFMNFAARHAFESFLLPGSLLQQRTYELHTVIVFCSCSAHPPHVSVESTIHVSPHIRRGGPPRAGSRRRWVSSATAPPWLVSLACRSMVL